ncbi:hypothetical protein AALP_AAs46459U000100, partial [Arabis alpina]
MVDLRRRVVLNRRRKEICRRSVSLVGVGSGKPGRRVVLNGWWWRFVDVVFLGWRW